MYPDKNLNNKLQLLSFILFSIFLFSCNSKENKFMGKWCIENINYSSVIDKKDTIKDNSELLTMLLLSSENYPELRPNSLVIKSDSIFLLNANDSLLTSSKYIIHKIDGEKASLQIDNNMDAALFLGKKERYLDVDDVKYSLTACDKDEL